MPSALRRLVALPLVAFAAASLVFLVLRALPGDPAELRLGETAPPTELAALRHEMGVDRPLAAQYGSFLRTLADGSLGVSWHSREPVRKLLAERAGATAVLAFAALSGAILVALPLALLAAGAAGRPLDRVLSTIAAGLAAVPSYASGPVLIVVFAAGLHWLPAGGRGGAASVVLPAVALAIPLAAALFRYTRATLGEELGRPYLRAAAARGAGPVRLLARHALANAAAPLVTATALQLGSLLTGAVVTETLFSWPGLGRLVVESIRRRDAPVVEGAVLLFAAVYVFAGTAADLLGAAIDPRLRTADRP